MEFFAVLICCAIAAALGFFIGATMRTSKLREPIKSEIQESTLYRTGSVYVLRDGTAITFDWSDSVVTIERGES